MEANMSLSRISFGERDVSDFPSPPAAASVDDAAGVLWLTVGGSAARGFASMTERMRQAVLDPGPRQPAPDQAPSVWLERAAAALKQVAPDLVRSLRHAASSACPVLVVRGLPSEPDAPATPYDGHVALAESFQAIMNLHAVVASLGLHPIAYTGESASTLHAVCPVAAARGQASSHGFDAALPFHTDYADRPIDEPVLDQSPAAAALAFAVERARADVPMECVPARVLLSRLTPEQIDAGRSEEFAVSAPDLFGGGKPPHLRRLFLPDGASGFRCRLNLGKMVGMTARASRLLHEIRDILSDAAQTGRIHVRRGDVVVMDNQRAIHRRATFKPRWDGTDRYFIRMSAAADPHAGLASDPLRPWLWS
jgi:hypothetical protein